MERIPERQDALNAFARVFLMPKASPDPRPNGHGSDPRSPDLSDEEVLALCRRAGNAAKFGRLFDHGDTSEHGGDDSGADMALVGIMSFYTQDSDQLDRHFRRSALMRPKWDSRRGSSTYGGRTIEQALSNVGERYRYRYSYKDGNTVTEPPGVEIASVDFAEMAEPGPREMILDPLVAKGWPTIFFGGAGVAKTIMALSLGQALVDPSTERWIVWPVATCSVVYLDLELNAEEQARRAYRIARGNGRSAPPKGLRYMSTFGVPRRKRGNVMQRALDECTKHDAGLLFVDSLGLALRGDPGDPTDVIAWFEDELAECAGAGVTVTMIDHQRRLQPGERNQSLGVFGSIYKENLARSMVQVELVRRDREEHSITTRLRPKKANFEELAEPVDVKTIFHEDRIEMYEQALEEEHRASEETLTADDRVLAALDVLGDAGPVAITDQCETLALGTVIKTVSKLRKAGKVEDTGEMEGTRRKVRRVTFTDPYRGNGNGNGADADPVERLMWEE